MKTIALLPLAICIFFGAANAVDRLTAGFPELPKDARAVAERGVACEYFGGEITGTIQERDEWIMRQFARLECDRIQRDLEDIRSKYRERTEILLVLKELDL